MNFQFTETNLLITGIKTIAMLSIVLGVLILFLYLIKRFLGQGSSGQGMIKLVSSFFIGPKKQIMLVDIMGKNIVLGVTTDRITYLTTIDSASSKIDSASSTIDSISSKIDSEPSNYEIIRNETLKGMK